MSNIKARIAEGLRRFPKGPPDTPWLNDLTDRVNRLILAEKNEERSGIASALILSIRFTKDEVARGSQEILDAGEQLIDLALAFTERRGAGSDPATSGLSDLRGALNVVQAVYAADFGEVPAAGPDEPGPELS